MSADVHSLIGPYVLDAVDEDEHRQVEQHLTECESCTREAAELREAVWRLSDITVAEPPQRLRDRVLTEAGRTRQEAPPERRSEPGPDAGPAPAAPKRIPRMRRLFALAAAVLIGFAGGVVTWALAQDPGTSESDRIAAVLEAADARVSTQDAEGGGRVTVVHSPSLDEAVVVVADLADVTDDRSYQVWLVEPEGQVSAGVMEPGDDSATMLVEGVGDAEVIGVTEEPAGGSEAPTTPMIADIELGA
ncbi:anti-sigma factor [Glycomyces salinus]|uniref:anti-sigma factor n=1 Tax=Glycomyces salinus TaxID=980294 RepID=UPI0018EB5F13|nr:anti-sigma factor [Glycomyces salinus]